MLRPRINRFGSVVLLFACVFVAGIFKANDVNAEDWNTIKAKAVFEGVYRCANSGAYAVEWDVANSDYKTGFIVDGKKELVSLPYALTEASDNLITCNEVMDGWTTILSGGGLTYGLLSGLLGNVNDDMSAMIFYAGENLDGNGGIGYKAKGETTEGTVERQTLHIQSNSSSTYDKEHSFLFVKAEWNGEWTRVENNTLVFPRVVEGKYMSGDTEANIGDHYYIGLCNENHSDCAAISRVYDVKNSYDFYFANSESGGSGSGYQNTCSVTVGNNPKLGFGLCGTEEEHKSPFVLDSKEYGSSNLDKVGSGGVSGGGTVLTALEGKEYKDKMIVGLNERNVIGYKVQDLRNHASLALTQQEIYDLYTYYLVDSNIFGANVICEGDPDYSDNGTLVNWTKNKQCRVVDGSWKQPKEKVYGVYAGDEEESLDHFSDTELGINDIINRLNQLNMDLIDARETSTYVPTDPTQPVETQGTCMSASGGGALAWLLCPALEGLAGASEDLYNSYVKSSLEIPPQLFSNNDNNGTKYAWGVFRNFANVFFIILFLLVIFSQLTGVGIDNYGIKKILPKLIVVAILINLSYVICQMAVDLSNILGNGFQALFNGLSTGGTPASNVIVNGVVDGEVQSVSVEISVPSDSGNFGIALLAIVVGVIFGAAVFMNPAILLSLLVAALGVAISVFFLFLLLSAREAAVIVLTVISPLAFACYILPNTKKLFDKWLKLGQGLLLVYPICGLLVGGGSYTSKLLMSAFGGDASFMRALMAMIVGIVPIFFIPSVLKSSFSAMGKLGATLTGLGSKARGAATNRIRKSEGYQNAQRMGLERKNRLRAGLDKEGQLTKRGERRANRAKFFGSAATRRQAARVQQARKAIGEAETANAVLTGALAASGIANAKPLEVDGVDQSTIDAELGEKLTKDQNYYYKDFLENANKGSITGMNAAIQAMKASGMRDKDIAKIMRFAINNGQIRNLDEAQRDQWMKDTVQKYGNDFLATDMELSHFMRTGGALTDGVLGDYGAYAEKAMGIDDVKPEDLVRLSSDSIAGLAKAGKITKSMAQRVMAMNPNITEDKKIMFGALASGAATGDLRDEKGKLIKSGTITSAKAFKQDATTLMNNHGAKLADNSTIRGATERQVADWTRNTPLDTNIVQRFANPKEGQRAPVWTTGDNPAGDDAPVDVDSGEIDVEHNEEPKSVLQQANLGALIDEQNDNFVGQTNIRRDTGAERKYSEFDTMPKQEGEKNKEYGARLKKIHEENAVYHKEYDREQAAKQQQWDNATQEERMEIMRHEGDNMTMRSMTPEAEARRAEFERKRAEILARNNQNNSQS